MITCKVKVIINKYSKPIEYPGLFNTTCDAIEDALNRFNPMTVSVKAIGDEPCNTKHISTASGSN